MKIAARRPQPNHSPVPGQPNSDRTECVSTLWPPGPTRPDGVAAEWGETDEALGRALPLSRIAEPSEIAQAVLFLASPR
jgi:NAD(P)-dependent dehydrogenase (short-subunit alcohol dehydrogenase family)